MAARALIRRPARSLAACELTYVDRVAIDPDLAALQHAGYAAGLDALGLEVTCLPPLEALPDSVFVEDALVALPEVFVLTRPGAASRRPEVDALAQILPDDRPRVLLEAPATLEGGDVLRVGRRLFVGRSTRTNEAGIAALAAVARPLGYEVVPVGVHGCLHLKTACAATGDGVLLVNPAWIEVDRLAGLPIEPVPAAEPWAANVLAGPAGVLVPAAHPRTAALLEARGLDVVTVDLSELAKAEAGPTCLSVLLDA